MSATGAAERSTSGATRTLAPAAATFRVTEHAEYEAMSLDPHLAMLLSTTSVGLMMAIAGLRKNGLEWRQQRRICPSCGRELRGKACACGP
jgi:hypothetical protein